MDDLFVSDLLALKARLLSGATVAFRNMGEEVEQQGQIVTTSDHDNLHGNEWIFLKLNNTSRVRMTLTENHPHFVLQPSMQGYGCVSLLDAASDELLADGLYLENVMVHCPRQLFFGLYEYCAAGCLFCPLSFRRNPVAFTADEMISDIENYESFGIEGIGITTGVPPHMTAEQVGVKLAAVVRQLAERTRNKVPIGVSTKHPSKAILYMLRDAGAIEARLNIEIFNPGLATQLMPNKRIDDILLSIEYACQVFGRGKVSSNMIIGIGESDDDVIRGIEELAKIGAIATLYPYDPVPENDARMRAVGVSAVGVPAAKRLVQLAVQQKRILAENRLDGTLLKTMCPACAASHIMPGRDL